MKQSTTTRLLYALGFVILTILASFCMAYDVSSLIMALG